MKILAVETSCDETAIAIAEFSGSKKKPQINVLSSIVSSQVKLHRKFGGVVPNLAKREHQRNLVPILLRALREAHLFELGIKNNELGGAKNIHNSKFIILNSILEREQDLFARIREYILPLTPPQIDAIAVTYGPGLAPALWVGVNFAKALAYLWGKPLMPINHMAGHLYSAFLQKPENSRFQILDSKFPALALLVSGGHTELVLMRGHPVRGNASNGAGGKFKILGETLDDAAGEAFDKVARLLGFPYPGGPQISALAEVSQTNADKTQTNAEISTGQRKSALAGKGLRESALRLPRPMINSRDYNFSFSGLKTAVLYLTRDLGVKKTRKLRPLIAKEFQDAVVEVLVKKTIRAAKEYKVKTVLLGGGVAANKKLRKDLAQTLAREIPSAQCLVPSASLTGDNALMIALAAYFTGKKKALDKVGANANLRLF